MRYLTLLFLAFFGFSSYGQYNNPYRITYDGTNYFVTNKGDGKVIMINSAFSTSTIISNLYSPNDIFSGSVGPYTAIVVIDSNQLKLFDKTTYSSIINIDITGVVEAHDGVFNPSNSNEFFVSDRAGNKIIKGTIGSPPFYPITYSTLVTGINRPAGMIFDSKGRLLVVTDTTDAEIHMINPSTGADSVLRTTNLDYLNDINEDNEGNYYVTCWGDEYLYRLDSNLNNEYKLIAFNNPSGIYVNKQYDYLALCCYNCNKVEFKNFHLYSPLDDVTMCTNDSFLASFNPVYQGIGTYNSNNQWVLEASDSNGNFSAPLVLATITTDTVPDYFRARLPNGTYASTGHKYRYRSTSPATLSYFTKDFILTQIPSAYIADNDTISICTGSSIVLGATAKADHTYKWSPSSYVNSTATSQTVFDTSSLGGYDVFLLEQDTVTGCSNLNTAHILVGPNLSIPQLADSVELCRGDSIQIGISGLPYFFSWSGSDSLDNSALDQPRFFDIESRMLKVIFSDFTLTCSGSDSIYAKVNYPKPLGYANVVADSACDGEVLSLNLSLDTNNSYNWSSKGGNWSNTDEYAPEFTFTDPAYYSIIIDITDKVKGCTNQDSLIVLIHANPEIFDVNNYTEHLCRGSEHELMFSVDTNLSYLWSAMHANIQGEQSYKPRFTVPLNVDTDTINAIAMDKGTSCVSEEQMILDVRYVPFNLNLKSEGTNIKLNDQTLIKLLNSGAELNIRWYVNGELKSAAADSIGWFPRDSFTHGDSLQAYLQWYNGIDSLCDFWSDKYEKTNLGAILDGEYIIQALYPNPQAAGDIVLNLKLNTYIDQVLVYTVSGQLLTNNHSGNQIRFSAVSGVYYVKLKIGEQWLTQKIIVF